MKLLPSAIIVSMLLNNFSFVYAQATLNPPIPGRKPSTPIKSVVLTSKDSKPTGLYDGTRIKLPADLAPPAMEITTEENTPFSTSEQINKNSLRSRLSISDVYIAAYPVDPRISAARNDLEAAEHHYDADFRRTWGPQIGLTASFLWRNSIGSPTPVTQGIPQGSGTTGSVGITLNQPIFNYQQILQKQQSKYNVTVNGVRNAIAQQDLIIRVVKAYLDVLRLEYSIQLKDEEYKAQKQHLRYLEEQLQVEPSMIVAVREARGRIETIEGVKRSLETNLAVAKGVFRQNWRIDLNSQQLKQLKKDVNFTPPFPSNPNDWIDQARSSNLLVQYNQGLVKLAEFDIKKVSAALYKPIINGTFSYAHNQLNGPGYDLATNGFAGGVTVTIPIFDGFYTQAKTKEMMSIQNRVINDLESAQITAQQSALESIMNINNGLQSIKDYQKSAKDADFVVRGKKEFFQNNLGSSSFEVLAAVQIRNQAMQQLIDEKFKVLLSKVILLQAVGTLTLNDLQDLDKLLQ